ncbi:hypothetical protein [Chelatococcus reniformis]|uniref:Uncharacterized protein n=1 Tax=Chelatococcus reniformis TaxID=1494448 RepID=A0A916TWZ6_9HYPH|nr:hypothetical protein [Chelatococcus reniformis]GGC49036.1 hypothetical protein GCM10010994_05300 [Chelatococcus reniformis]
MSGAPPEHFGLLPRLVIVFAIALTLTGVVLYGVSGEVIERVWYQLVARSDGPMSFRFVLQPTMAAIAAIHDGVKDERTAHRSYFWTFAVNRRERALMMREALTATARIILLGIVIDLAYQLLVLKRLYPAEAPIIALFLGLAPYLLIRGPATIIARRWRGDPSGEVR